MLKESKIKIYYSVMAYHKELMSFEAVKHLAESGNLNEALKLWWEEKPLDYLKNHKTIEKSLRSLYLRKNGLLLSLILMILYSWGVKL